MISQNSNLTGKLLVAMPGMGDPRFTNSVIYIGTHSADGAMGLIVNKPNPKLELKTLLGQGNDYCHTRWLRPLLQREGGWLKSSSKEGRGGGWPISGN